MHFKIHVAISVNVIHDRVYRFRPEFIVQFTAMTAHLEIDYLLNTRSFKIIAKNGALVKK